MNKTLLLTLVIISISLGIYIFGLSELLVIGEINKFLIFTVIIAIPLYIVTHRFRYSTKDLIPFSLGSLLLSGIIFILNYYGYSLNGKYTESIIFVITSILSLITIEVIAKSEYRFRKKNSLFLVHLPSFALIILAGLMVVWQLGCTTSYISPRRNYSITIQEKCKLLGCYPLHVLQNQGLFRKKIGEIDLERHPSCSAYLDQRDIKEIEERNISVKWSDDERQVSWTWDQMSVTLKLNP